MEFIDDFIARKHGKKQIVYLDPILEPILKETNGIIVYQE
jgi:DNA polymerase-3 subunit alpha